MSLLKELLLDKVNIDPENIHSPGKLVSKEDVYQYCKNYEEEIEACGGIDLALCEIGAVGNLAFNEPGSQLNSSCRLMLLGSDARHMASSQFNSSENVPRSAVTLGISNLMSARRIVCVAWGENKANIVKRTIEGDITDLIPSSFLQTHRRAKIVLDLSAAEALTRISRPWLVTSCEWDEKLIRRAIVWLCKVTGKPILKLTDKDYNDNGLSELVALFGSAYNVNIRIFNSLQHTITGWPGGKPNADDTFRPERAKPYPKRVIVFSPHPDDDVISMGGTLKRLADQKHDVHVAYETSGNIAVGDEDMMRYIMLIDNIAKKFKFDTPELLKKSNEIHKFIGKKKDGESDTPDIRFIKTMIRQGEARTACNYIGIKPQNVHFLNLPFYETGGIKKGQLTEKDIDIIVKLLREVKPHQIYAAGDLADPHGTHRTAMEAVLGALDVVRDDEWLKECHLWLYRGAWMEWDLGMVDMAVPLSPDELIMKRHAIYRHLSQKDIMPFPGSDPREFWQRAEERTQNTAQLYDKLGMAEYQAIEVFVKMF